VLTPDRPHRFATGAFIRADWPSMTELRDRIDGRSPSNASTPRGGQLVEKRSRALG
jgi:hypothetical protein